MGINYSKNVPVSKITPKMLTANESINNSKSKVQILSPKLCSVVLRNNSKTHSSFCSDDQLSFLKQFLSRNSNFKTVSDKNFIRNERIRKNVETEISRALRKTKTKSPNRKNVVLSSSAQQNLNTILRTSKTDIYFSFRKNNLLLSRIILPELESLLRLSKCSDNFSFSDFVRSVFQQKLLAKDLRANPKGLARNAGLDRAHILSLFLAVKLWKQIYGHSYISSKNLGKLRQALSSETNVFLTCKFANRTLHVKYDNEIAAALGSEPRLEISSGAKLRVEQILKTLNNLRSQSEFVKDFCDKSSVILKPFSA